jgi:hypothetical protein
LKGKRCDGAPSGCSEIRLFGRRNMLETLVEHIGVVFGTNSLFPGNEGAPVGEIRGPFRGEDI